MNLYSLYNLYIIINASNEGKCVEFERKSNNTTLVLIFSNCLQVLKMC